MAIETDMTARPTAPPMDGGPASDQVRRDELAHFLRRCRERISPDQVGLPPGGRRRTPGLRREEVAQLAGVGVTWYTWLEQAREIRASEQVLDALSRALQLDADERQHLYALAGAPSASTVRECNAIDPSMLVILEQMGTYPASVVNGRYDILAYNRAYEALCGDLAALDFDQRNTMWLMFTSDLFRELLIDWETATRRCVAQFRALMEEHITEPAWRSMVKRLQAASPTFGEFWEEHRVAPTANVVKQFRHPDLGVLRFNATSLFLSQRRGGRLIVYTPADEQTMEAHVRLADVTPHPLYATEADPAA
ncbi:MAG: helix-turn-helix transcriptional regulator [Acidimicrobiales bacterium]